MNIITGYRGEPHITAQEDRDINLGVVGNSLTDVYVLDVGQQLEADIVSANEVRIRDGILVMQGCAASIDYGAYDSLTISNGTQGMLRTDIIAAQYEKDADTNVESLTLVVIEGTPDASDPQAPSLQGGDIQGGDNLVQLPLYQVNLDGVAIDSVEAQFSVTSSLSDNTISADVLDKWDNITGQTADLNNIIDYLADDHIFDYSSEPVKVGRYNDNGTWKDIYRVVKKGSTPSTSGSIVFTDSILRGFLHMTGHVYNSGSSYIPIPGYYVNSGDHMTWYAQGDAMRMVMGNTGTLGNRPYVCIIYYRV